VVDNGVHDQPLPPGFTITPYHDEPSADRPATVRSGSDRLRIGARLLAAGLAVGASWCTVLVLTSWQPSADGDPHGGGYLRYTSSGWGRTAVTSSGPLDFTGSGSNGPKFGVLLCIAAAALLIAAAVDWLPGRLRWQPNGRLLTALTGSFLLAVVLCEVITVLPYGQGDATDVRFGLSPWLAAAGCLLAVLSCLPWPDHSRQSTGQ